MSVENTRRKMRAIPAMDILLSREWVQPWLDRLGWDAVKKILSAELTTIRRKLLTGEDVDLSESDPVEVEIESGQANLRSLCLAALARAERPNLRRVINATGVVIHTNLGRSLLSESAIQAMQEAARRYCNLEYDLDSGSRGQRNSLVESLLCELTGAEAALVVNNNAAAVLLALFALARGSEVIVSRGELVEIGGSFRIPEIMELSGADLVEVGTTNRTHLYDYERAITERTSMLLKVHPSNFRILGFTAAPEREELARLAHGENPTGSQIILMEDAGSGVLIDGEILGLHGETSVRECLAQGVDLVTFSGDKMLGGPQIGAIVGRRSIINRLRKHQLLRTLRVDKATLAAFEATLRLYRRGDLDAIPTLEMLRRSDSDLFDQATHLSDEIKNSLGKVSKNQNDLSIEVVRVEDTVGGGSYPERPLSGWGVSVRSETTSAGELQALLRGNSPAIVCGAHEDSLVFHVRTLRQCDDQEIATAIATLTQGRCKS